MSSNWLLSLTHMVPTRTMQATEVRSLNWEAGILYCDPAPAKTVRCNIILRYYPTEVS